MPTLRLAFFALPALLGLARLACGQTPDAAGDMSRIFLTDGRALPSYGDYVVVGDRLVFVLPVGMAGAGAQQQLMSLPVSTVDMTRTAQYTEALRARQYADARGPAEYSQVTAEVTETLAAIEKEPDPKRRIAMAEEARSRLLAWPASHYGYRAAEVNELAGLFSDVISEMQHTTGQARFAVDLRAGPAIRSYPPPLPALSLRESIELALTAASVADTPADRPAILKAALTALAGVPGADDLHAEVDRRLQDELTADAAYSTLTRQLTMLADAALRRGDVRSIEALQAELGVRDRSLGSRRPEEVKALSARLEAALARARTYREALDHWNQVGTRLFRYEREVRPILSALDGLQPVLEHIRDSKFMSYDRVVRALARLNSLTAPLGAIDPPQDVQSVHSTLRSALFLAIQACERRRQIDAGPNAAVAQDAAAAAAGTLLLAAQARQDLLARLRSPKLQ